MAQFGDLLAELRQDRGLTQSELGKVISVTSGTISNYEHGFHLPDLEKLVLLADYFGVSTDYFMVEIVVDYLGKLVIIFLGELDGLLYALVIFVVLDYITGICAAIQAKHLSSNIGAKGIAKKVAIFLVISVAHVADQYLVDSTDVLRSMTTLFYLSNEGISIFENIGKIGIPLPGKLNNLLSRFEDIKNQMK